MSRGYTRIKANLMPFASPVVVVSAGNDKKRSFSTYIMFGQFNEDPPIIGIGIKEKRFTYSLIKEFGEFVVHIVSEDTLKLADLGGTSSGRFTDKFETYRVDLMEPRKVKAPVIKGFPVILECVFVQEIPFKDHILVLGKVVESYALENIVAGGSIDVEKASLVLANYTRFEYLSGLKHLKKWGFSLSEE